MSQNDRKEVNISTSTQVIPIEGLNWKQLKEQEHEKRIAEFVNKLKALREEYNIEIKPQLIISSEGTRSQLLFRALD